MGAFASPYLCDDEAVSTNDSLALACVKEKAVHENRNGFEFATALGLAKSNGFILLDKYAKETPFSLKRDLYLLFSRSFFLNLY